MCPATSKAQQALFGIAHSIQTGKRSTKGVSDPAKKIAKNVSKKDVKDFASTPTKGLPKKVKKENKLVSFIRNEVKSALKESYDWPYFTLKGGFLFDEGGDKIEGTPKFKDSGEAEQWLEDNNVRGSVKESIKPSLAEIVKELPPEKKHQLAIAYKTLKMPDAMVGVMGGPNKEQAKQIIKQITGKDYKERKTEAWDSKEKQRQAIKTGREKAQKDPQSAYAQYKVNVKDKANAMPYEKWYAQWKEKSLKEDKMGSVTIKGQKYELAEPPYESEQDRGEGGIVNKWLLMKNGKQVGSLVQWYKQPSGVEFGYFQGVYPHSKKSELKANDVKFMKEGLFGGSKSGGAKLPAKFKAKLERKIAGGKTVDFDCQVEGYFEGVGGKPKFTATKITVDGIPQMNIRNMYPGEIQTVNDYAINTIYPKMLGIKKESAPKGWEGTVKAMKKHPEIENPFALANYEKKKGYTPHKLDEATSMTADKLMDIDYKVEDKLGTTSGGQIRDSKVLWEKYVKMLGMLLKGIAPVSQSTLLKLENENHHNLMQALGQLGLVDPKAPYYKGLTKTPMTKFEGKDVTQPPQNLTKMPTNEGILREVVQELIKEETEAGRKAKSLGLDYMKFGRYGKKGKVTHKIENGKLVPFEGGDIKSPGATLKPTKTGGFKVSDTPKVKGYKPGSKPDDKALNFWRDAFLKHNGKMTADQVKKLRQMHPGLNLAYNDLSDPKQYGGAYIVKKGNDYEWPGQEQ